MDTTIKLNNGVEMPLAGIGTFLLSPAEASCLKREEIFLETKMWPVFYVQAAALDKNTRYYTSTPEMLKKYAEMVPPVDEQK